jgi:hypothetical protein
MIDYQYNFDDSFFRMVTLSLAKTLNDKITWVYYFASGKKCVKIPVFNATSGQERFLLDAFIDDITDKRVELDTTQYQRCVITMTSISTKSDEFANPNILLPKVFKLNNKLKEIWTKVKAIPITINYELQFKLDSENEVYKCFEKILYLLFNYRIFRMNYFGMLIENVLTLPDDKEITIPRDIGGFDTDTKKTIKFNIIVSTYYPVWEIDTDKVECYDDELVNYKRVFWDVYLHDFNDIPLYQDDFDNFIDTDKKTKENFNNFMGYTPTGYTMEL